MAKAPRQLAGNILSLSAVQLVSTTLPLLSLPYLASTLGAEQLGRMAFALSVAQMCMILSDYGFNLSAPREVSVHRDDPQRVARIFCAVTVLRLLFASAGFLVVAVTCLVVPRFEADAPLLLGAYLLVLGNAMFAQWLFQGLEQLKGVSIIQITSRVLVFAGIFVLVKDESDVLVAVLLQASGTVLGGLIALPSTFAALRGAHLQWPGGASIRHELREGWHVFLSSAAVNVYTASNAFFLGMLAAPAAVGHFHVAEKLIKGVQMALGPVSNAVYPHVSRLAATDEAAALRFNRRLLILLCLAAACLGAATYAAAPWLIANFFGPSYAPAVTVLRIFAWVPLLVACSNVLGVQTMLPLGMKVPFSRILLGAAFVNFAVFPLAAHFWGASGAAFANLVVEGYVVITMAICLHFSNRSPLTSRLAPLRTSP